MDSKNISFNFAKINKKKRNMQKITHNYIDHNDCIEAVKHYCNTMFKKYKKIKY